MVVSGRLNDLAATRRLASSETASEPGGLPRLSDVSETIGPPTEPVKPGETRRVQELCVTLRVGSLIQARVGSFGGVGRRVNLVGFAA